MRGSDKGDYVLPGNAQTYPNGGLHGRYYNDLDSTSNLYLVLNPSKSEVAGLRAHRKEAGAYEPPAPDSG